MLFKYNPPQRLEIVADGRSVAVRDQKLGTQDLYFIGQTPLKFLLADHIDLAKDTKVKRVEVDDKAVDDRDRGQGRFRRHGRDQLVFDPVTFALKQWTVIDAQGFQTVVSLFNVDLVTQARPGPVPHRRSDGRRGRGEAVTAARANRWAAGKRVANSQSTIMSCWRRFARSNGDQSRHRTRRRGAL